jgi:hypothetical protein
MPPILLENVWKPRCDRDAAAFGMALATCPEVVKHTPSADAVTASTIVA